MKKALMSLSVGLMVGLSGASALAVCEDKIEMIAAESAMRSDSPASPVFHGTLLAGMTYQGAQAVVGPYKSDMYLFINSGSYHSGWFQEALVLDLNCRLVNTTLLYGE